MAVSRTGHIQKVPQPVWAFPARIAVLRLMVPPRRTRDPQAMRSLVTDALTERDPTPDRRVVFDISPVQISGREASTQFLWFGSSGGKPSLEWGGAGVLGAVAAVIAFIAWFAIA